MKTKLSILVCVVCLGISLANCAAVVQRDPVAVAADALVARPLCFAATIVGSAIFVVALPIAASSGTIHSTADALVMKPAWWTFRRPMGDFGYSEEYTNKWPGKQEPRRFVHRPHRAKVTKT